MRNSIKDPHDFMMCFMSFFHDFPGFHGPKVCSAAGHLVDRTKTIRINQPATDPLRGCWESQGTQKPQIPMTDPWCWYMNASMTGFFVDGIHGAPYIRAPVGSVMGYVLTYFADSFIQFIHIVI